MTKTLTQRAIFLFCLGDFSRAIFSGLTEMYLMYIFQVDQRKNGLLVYMTGNSNSHALKMWLLYQNGAMFI